jgi:hypothetical protein
VGECDRDTVAIERGDGEADPPRLQPAKPLTVMATGRLTCSFAM